MKKLITLLLLLAVLTARAEQPNLLVIHTDEHSFRTLSCYRELMTADQAYVWGKGAGVETPHVDRIADEGAICLNYYASSPVCTPSRASLITGLYPQATGAWKNGEHLRKDVKTFAQILKAEGYATSYTGKWHLEGHDKYNFNIRYKAGFDDNRYMMNGGHAPYFHKTPGGMEGISQNRAAGFPESEIVHLTDFFTEKTLEILERDKGKPFCLMLSIPDPHTPDYARPPYHTMYDHMEVTPPKTMGPEYTAKKPAWARSERNEATGFDAGALRQYFGMVKHIDDKVGEILAFLDKNGLTDNTIVVFTADHGDMFFEHNRRNKGVPYEASAKIPFVIRYPEKIPPGKVIRTAYTNVDFVPTVLDLMDIKTDVKFHGLNTADDFTAPGREVESDRIAYFAEANGSWVAAVNNRYKLVVSTREAPWLFDLQDDPDEVVNFYNAKGYKKISGNMMKELKCQLELYKEPALRHGKLIFE